MFFYYEIDDTNNEFDILIKFVINSNFVMNFNLFLENCIIKSSDIIYKRKTKTLYFIFSLNALIFLKIDLYV